MSHSGSVPINAHSTEDGKGRLNQNFVEEEKWPKSQILIGLHASLGLSSMESKIPSHLGKKKTKHFPGLLSSCYNVLELLVLASFTHEYKTTVSGMTVPEKESEGLI